jgi:ABC-type polysaccharide/polyol phosphate export permease
MTDGLDYFAALPILLAFLVFTTGIPLTAVLLPLILAIQILFTVGLGFLLATANVYLRDVKLFVEVALLLGFYLTPVFYRPGLISDERLRTLLSLNPMSQLLDAYRRILIQGTLPDVKSTAALIASGILIFVAGYMVYARKAPVFVDEL